MNDVIMGLFMFLVIAIPIYTIYAFIAYILEVRHAKRDARQIQKKYIVIFIIGVFCALLIIAFAIWCYWLTIQIMKGM